jgi:hypothetical protein
MRSMRRLWSALACIAGILALPTGVAGEAFSADGSLDSQNSVVELRTAPPGLQVTLDGVTAPSALREAFEPGSQVTIDTPDPQLLFGYDHAFGAWNQPFPKRATITVPASDVSYEASFRFTGRRTLLGGDALGTDTESAQPGGAANYRLLASRSGSVDRLRLYVDGDSAASQLGLALYADAAGVPGALLGAATGATVTPGAWNEVSLDPEPKLSAGQMYWVGVQNPAASAGALIWRVTPEGSASAYALGPAPPPPDGGIDVEPGSLSFAAAAGGGAPPPQSIVVQANNGGCGPCAWSISDDDSGWLSETPGSGEWPTEVRVSVDPSGLEPGIYRATVTVSRGPDGDTTAVPVALRVAAPADDLVGAWSFDESSGSTVSDSSGHGNDGTITGAQRTSVGVAGGALAFDGTDDRVEIPDSASLDLSEGMTVEGWVRPNVLAGGARPLAVKEDDDDEPLWGLDAANTGGLPSGQAFTDVARSAHGSTKVAPVPTWTHLATTYDGTQIRLYLNGRLVGSAAQRGPLATGPGPLRIGAGAWGERFDGLIDEVRVYDRALTAGEIRLDLGTPISP